MIDLDKLEQLHAAATPGPWVDEGIGYIRSPKERKTIAECMPPICRGLKNIQQHGINAAYIVAACNTLPDLVAENRALRERVRELERQRSHLAKLLGDLCTSQEGGQCPLFYTCPASGFGWSCGNAIQENWLYVAEQAAKEDGE